MGRADSETHHTPHYQHNCQSINELDTLVHVEGGIYVDFQCSEDRLISETFPFEGDILLNLCSFEELNFLS